MKLYSQDGVEMMEIISIAKDGERLAIKGKVMGAMTTKIFVRPEDLWAAFRLLSVGVLFWLPLMLLKGARAAARGKKRGAA